MARVARFVRSKGSAGAAQPTEVDCQWRVFEIGGDRIVQLDTFGSKARANPGKQSQTLQLDRRSGMELIAILQNAFR